MVSQSDYSGSGEASASREDREAQTGPPPGGGFAEEFEQAVAIGDQAIRYLTGLFSLARLEALLTVRTIPKIIVLWLLMMPLALLTWLSFSVMLAWAVYSYFQIPLVGFFAFFLQQISLLLGVKYLLYRYRQRIKFRNTRDELNTALEGLQNELGKKSKTAKT